jgi:hypothetical protein
MLDFVLGRLITVSNRVLARRIAADGERRFQTSPIDTASQPSTQPRAVDPG